MFYEFKCDFCDNIKEYCQSIILGPPKNVKCDRCNNEMTHQLGGQFVLRGQGWPGKDLKSRDYHNDESKERLDHEIAEDKRMKSTCDEVLKVRRKGRKAVNKFKEEHPQKWKDYQEAMKKGVRGK